MPARMNTHTHIHPHTLVAVYQDLLTRLWSAWDYSRRHLPNVLHTGAELKTTCLRSKFHNHTTTRSSKFLNLGSEWGEGHQSGYCWAFPSFNHSCHPSLLPLTQDNANTFAVIVFYLGTEALTENLACGISSTATF